MIMKILACENGKEKFANFISVTHKSRPFNT